MKKIIFSFFAVLVLLLSGCNSKTEENSATGDSDKYFRSEVGRIENGEFVVTNLEAIQTDWEERLSKRKKIVFKDIKIVKAYTHDEQPVEYYLLVGSTAAGNFMSASLLNLKDNTFYFDTREDQDGTVLYSNIVCEGICTEGCLPVVNIHNGTRYLNCSPCANCVKNDMEIR